MFGPERSRLEKQLAMSDLEKELADLEDWQEVLHIELGSRHPDDAFSGVPYEKGALFLLRLEELFGRARFDAFLRGYFDAHAFRSITTAEFVAYLQQNLLASDPAKAASLDLDRWLNKPGLPPDAPRTQSPGLALVDGQRQRFLAGTPARQLDTRGWVTQQWQHFIQGLPADVSTARLADLDARLQVHRQRQQRDPVRLAGAGHQAWLPPRRRPAGGVPAERGPAQVPEAAVHRAGPDRGRDGSGRGPSTARRVLATMRWRRERSTRSSPGVKADNPDGPGGSGRAASSFGEGGAG